MCMKYVLDVTVTIFLFSCWDDQVGGTRSTHGKYVEDFNRIARNNLPSGGDNCICDGNVKMNLK